MSSSNIPSQLAEPVEPHPTLAPEPGNEHRAFGDLKLDPEPHHKNQRAPLEEALGHTGMF